MGVMSNSVSIELNGMSNETKIEYTGMTNTIEISGVLMENELKINLPGKSEIKLEMDAGALMTGYKIGGLSGMLHNAALITEMENAVKAKQESVALEACITNIRLGQIKIGNQTVQVDANGVTLLS